MSLRPAPSSVSASAQPATTPALPERYLLPGELFVGHEPTLVKTILGSCIAVCLWDSNLGIGGLNHFLLPKGVSGIDSVGRFGNLALPELRERMLRLGSRTQTLTAKVFGGGTLVARAAVPNHIGTQNVELAMSWLANERIAVIASDTGGNRGRKLVFNTADGSASLWML